MAKYIIMPKLGFNMDQGTVVQWLKKEGDAIEAVSYTHLRAHET